MSEFELILPQGIGYIATRVLEFIEKACNDLPESSRILGRRLLDHLETLERQVDELESQVVKWRRKSDATGKLVVDVNYFDCRVVSRVNALDSWLLLVLSGCLLRCYLSPVTQFSPQNFSYI